MNTLRTNLRSCLKDILPPKLLTFTQRLIGLIHGIKRVFQYPQYDSSVYWRERARGSEGSRVLWSNEGYNQLYRRIQRGVIETFLINLDENSLVLDVGCGTGVVARMITELKSNIFVDGIDFPEMIQIAKRENPSARISYIESSAEEYFDPGKHYELVISSACFAAIRDILKMEQAITNCIRMLDEGGIVLMMDPFHRWNYLARVKYSSRQLIRFMKQRGFELTLKSGVLFWPYREWLANSNYHGAELERKFAQGEKLLSCFGKVLWADYKILAFRKK